MTAGNMATSHRVSLDGTWHAPTGLLCPLIAGAALSDLAAEIAGGRRIETRPIGYPILLAPYAAAVARSANRQVTLSWGGIVFNFTAKGHAFEGNHTLLSGISASQVFCRLSEDNGEMVPTEETARAIDQGAWTILGEFARRTYAPATEASRLTGAGAGLKRQRLSWGFVRANRQTKRTLSSSFNSTMREYCRPMPLQIRCHCLDWQHNAPIWNHAGRNSTLGINSASTALSAGGK